MLSGVRVADVLFTGCCDTSIGMLDFIAQEFIVTETVEAGYVSLWKKDTNTQIKDDERVPQEILYVVDTQTSRNAMTWTFVVLVRRMRLMRPPKNGTALKKRLMPS